MLIDLEEIVTAYRKLEYIHRQRWENFHFMLGLTHLFRYKTNNVMDITYNYSKSLHNTFWNQIILMIVLWLWFIYTLSRYCNSYKTFQLIQNTTHEVKWHNNLYYNIRVERTPVLLIKVRFSSIVRARRECLRIYILH